MIAAVVAGALGGALVGFLVGFLLGLFVAFSSPDGIRMEAWAELMLVLGGIGAGIGILTGVAA